MYPHQTKHDHQHPPTPEPLLVIHLQHTTFDIPNTCNHLPPPMETNTQTEKTQTNRGNTEVFFVQPGTHYNKLPVSRGLILYQSGTCHVADVSPISWIYFPPMRRSPFEGYLQTPIHYSSKHHTQMLHLNHSPIKTEKINISYAFKQHSNENNNA